MVNQISSGDETYDNSNAAFGNFRQNLNTVQCQQVMSLLSTHLSSAARINYDSPDTSSTPYSHFPLLIFGLLI